MNVSCDLHTHSSFSDGSLSPTELARVAAERGIRYWALTDHDTVEGLSEGMAAADREGIIMIPGVEISIEDYRNRPFHLLGLGIDRDNALLKTLCLRQTQRRRRRFTEICERLTRSGIEIDGRKILDSFRGAPGRVRIARELVERQTVKSVEEAFALYLDNRSGNALPFEKTPLEEAVRAVHAAGGFAFAAHPLSLNLNWEQTEAFLNEIRDRGVDGVEVAHSGSTVTRQRYVEAVARRLNLLMCGGSDFHGSGKPQAILGRLSNGKPIPLTYLPDVLKEKYCQANGKRI